MFFLPSLFIHIYLDGALDEYQYDSPHEYEYEYDDVDIHTTADDTMMKTHIPVIVTQPTHVQVPLRGIISLPCNTDFLPG